MNVPFRLRQRPVDARGYVVPFVVANGPDGKPAHGILHPEKVFECVAKRRCGVCGLEITRTAPLYFIGGPLCEANRLFIDPGMHRDCARFAMVTCPHLATSKGKYLPASVAADRGARESPAMNTTHKAVWFMLGGAMTCRVVNYAGEMLIHTSRWRTLEYWRDGKQIGEREARELAAGQSAA